MPPPEGAVMDGPWTDYAAVPASAPQDGPWSDYAPQGAAPAQTEAPPPPSRPKTPPQDSISAYEPSLLNQARDAFANSAIGRSVQSTMPKVAGALNVRPSESLASPTYQQHGEQLLAPEYLAPALGEAIGSRKTGQPAQANTPGQNRLEGSLEELGSLTDKTNLALGVGTAAAGGLTAGFINPSSARLLSRLIGAGFSLQMLQSLYRQHKGYRQAVDSGDLARAQQIQGAMGVTGVLALLSGAHAARGGGEPAGVPAEQPAAANGPWNDYAADTTRTFTAAANKEGRPIVQGSSDADAIRASAAEQQPTLKATIQGAVAGVPGAEVDGSRVKEAESQQNKADRGKPIETQSDHLGVRIAADTPAAAAQAETAIAKDHTITSTEPLTTNGLEGTQVMVQSGKPGDANQVSEVQILPTAQVKAMEETEPLYEKEKKALADGNDAQAERLAEESKAIHQEALHPEKEAEKPASSNQTKGESGKSPEPANVTAEETPAVAPLKLAKGSAVALDDGRTGTINFYPWDPRGRARLTLADGSRLPSVPVEKLTAIPSPESTGGKWIGVDLDGTLAHFDGFKGGTDIGAPVPAMLERVKQWLAEGKDIRIFTARIADDPSGATRKAIQQWSEQNIGRRLPITNMKDPHMEQLWDDRAVQVERNTGEQLGEPENTVQPVQSETQMVAPADRGSEPAATPAGEAAPATAGGEAQPAAAEPSSRTGEGVGNRLAPGDVGRAKVSELQVDPKRFQYKLNTDAGGATGKLKDVQWNDALSGIITAWRDPENGVDYVVNGHHRIDLAMRHGVDELAVRMLPEDVKTAEEARTVGALQNIAEGQGTAVDAAKFLRDTGLTPADLSRYGISLSGPVAEGGTALAKLDQRLFDDVVAGGLPERRGIAIARAADTPERQDALVKLIDRAEAKGRTVTNATIEEMGRMVKGAGERTATEDTLFGKQQRMENLALEKAEVSASLRNQIAQEKKLFAGLSSTSKAEKVGEVGKNRIDAEENKKVATLAEQAQETYDRLSTKRGPVDDILNLAAKRIAEGENANTVKSEAYRSIRTALSEALAGKQESSSERVQEDTKRPEEAAATEPAKPPTKEVEAKEPALPGLEAAVTKQKESAADLKAETEKTTAEQTLTSPKADISRAAGEMERDSPLFHGTGAGGNRTLFEGKVEPDEEVTQQASDLGARLFSGFADPELFRRLFPDVAKRIDDWVRDEPTEGTTQRSMMRQTRGEMDRRVAGAMQKLSGAMREWRSRLREDSIAFWNAVESGETDSLPAKDRALAETFKGAFDQMKQEIQQLKPEVLRNYIENYFPHLWERPSVVGDAMRAMLNGKRPFAGKASFLKQRTIPTMQDGLDLGFKPKTWNPVELFLLKYSEMAQFLMGHQTLAMMKEAGTAKFVRVGEQSPDGWTQIDDRIGTVFGKEENAEGKAFTIIRGHYYAPAEAARVFNNYVSRGMAGRSGVYDVLNWTNQNLNALQLGVSAFHAATTTINAATSDVALGLQQLAEGKPLKAGASIAKGATIVPSLVSTVRNGGRLMREYLDPGSYEKFEVEADALAEAGGRIRQNVIEIKPLDRVINAWRNGAAKEGLTHLPAALLDASVRPVMEHYVPRMKLGAFYAMAHDILEQAGKNEWSPEEVRGRMQKAWDSVDNRFGQMVYDNLFWHKGVRDALQLATRSVGWNFGDLRELGGAATDTVREGAKAMGGEMPELTPRMAFGLALPMVSALLGGVLTYLWTGRKPDTWKDYFYPKTADGTRHSIPGYMKDVFAFVHAPVQTTLNKLGPVWEMSAEAINNRDFYGTEIRHPDDPMIHQLGQFATWVGKEAIPFSFSSGAKLLEQRGAEPTLGSMIEHTKKNPGDIALGQLGFQQAPGFMQNSAAMNKALEYGREDRPPGTKTKQESDHSRAYQAVVKMYRSGKIDRQQVDRYRKEGLLPGPSIARAAMDARYPPIVLASRSLHLEQFLNVYAVASPAEQEQLRPLLATKGRQLEQIPEGPQRDKVLEAYERAISVKTSGPLRASTHP